MAEFKYSVCISKQWGIAQIPMFSQNRTTYSDAIGGGVCVFVGCSWGTGDLKISFSPLTPKAINLGVSYFTNPEDCCRRQNG